MSTIARTDPPGPTSSPGSWPRRSVLAGSGAALLVCAACGSANSAGGATAGSSTSSTPSASSSTPTVLASVADIPTDSGLIVDAPSGKIILAKAAGKVVAHTAVCTHQGAIIDGAGVCPLHGSKFDVTTGAVLGGPATSPLAAVTVTESDGKVFST